jgi:hypothetical protein
LLERLAMRLTDTAGIRESEDARRSLRYIQKFVRRR